MSLDRLRRLGTRIRRTASGAVNAWRTCPVSDIAPRTEAWYDLLPFTTHRINLGDGRWTMDGGVDADRDHRIELIAERCPNGLEGITAVDLGCLEGGFTLALARRGALVLGVEAREVSVQRCNLARDLARVGNASFACADLKDELPRHDSFDVVLATGILYHVADPAALLAIMRGACRGFALIDTHVADPDVVTHDCSPVVERESAGRIYRGRMFKEYDPDTPDASKEAMLWAAWSDADAFWPFEPDLVAMILDAGFARVERVDLDRARRSNWQVDQNNRVMYVAYAEAAD